MAKTKKRNRKGSHPILRAFALLVSISVFILIAAGLLYVYVNALLPDVSALKDAQLQVPLKIYTRDGQLIGSYGEMQRTPIPLSKIPKPLIEAVLATEDQRYFEHSGIDVLGLLRASAELLITGTKAQGGSTITMQVARNFYLSRQKTFGRKFNEILLAMKIDRELSKEKILELYLNKIYLGKRAYGVAAAAEVYYGKPLAQLTLPELALIAGLPKAPSSINPVTNPAAAKKRRDHVLERMLTVGYIDKASYDAAISAPITASYHGLGVMVKAPYVAEMVRNLMITSFGSASYTEGYKVYTTIDSKLQQAANDALTDAVLAYDQRHGYRGAEQNLGSWQESKLADWQDTLSGIPVYADLVPAAVIAMHDHLVTVLTADGDTLNLKPVAYAWTGKRKPEQLFKLGDVIRIFATDNGDWQLAQIPEVQGAIVALNPNNGAIAALNGGFDYSLSNFNRATQAQRQPGSNFKPFIYAAALNKGFTLASLVNDAPVVFMNSASGHLWRPQNDDRKFLGPTRLRLGLVQSRNLISIRILQAVGLPAAMNYIGNFGFNTQKLPHDLTLALGTGPVTPLEVATGYAVFANGGYKVAPFIVDHVLDANGKLIYQTQAKAVVDNCAAARTDCAPRVIEPEIAYLITSALQDVIRYGTAQAALSLNRTDLAGKTGTTNDQHDTWFSGFNSDIVVTTWVGFDQPSSLHEYGARAALPMWIEFMRQALAGKPEHTLIQPPGIVTAKIDPATGLLAVSDQPDALVEYFRAEHVPTQQANGAKPVVTDDLGNTPAPINSEEPGDDPLF